MGTRDDDGSITPLVVGMAVVVALLVAVVVDTSAGFLERASLSSTADAAALAATEGVEADRAYLQGLGPEVGLDPGAVRRHVTDHLVTSGATRRFDNLTWSVVVRGATVVVRLRSSMDLPLHLPGSPRRTWVAARASAVLSVGR